MCIKTETKADDKKIKCVVWDLDNTIWHGTLLEDNKVTLRDGIVDIIAALDNRGILQSIASKNDPQSAMSKLDSFNIRDYFLYPQINWNSKSASIQAIAKAINIGIDTIAFVDDQIYEREEVIYSFPEVYCIDAENIAGMLDLPALIPRFITEESKQRRLMYMSDSKRNEVEASFVGPKNEFLTMLRMVLTIREASQDDLQRAEELTIRTHQLNTTGYTYSYDKLDCFRQSDKHKLLIANLNDTFGEYGKIGLALLEVDTDIWTIKLLLMSCRVMSRGVGMVFINHIRNLARKAGVTLRAEFLQTDVNRMMYMTYKFSHFKEYSKKDNLIIFENDLSQIINDPEYLVVSAL
jgi:FkbH-like protein